MKKYQTGHWKQDITEIEVERETDKSVWVDGHRSSKSEGFYRIFDTRNDAAEFLLELAERKMESAIFRASELKKAYAELDKRLKQ
jgi:hypothetical protein